MPIDRRDFLSAAALGVIGASLPAFGGPRCAVTSSASQGPYWRPDAPFTTDLRRAGGEVLAVQGIVRSAATCNPIEGALLEIWQADHHGHYDLDYDSGAFFGRARVRSGKSGAFAFRTVRPAPYGSRPAHIHFLLNASGHRPLITQLYFEDDPHLHDDPLDAVRPDLIRPIRSGVCTFDVVLAAA
jgi:protocatechuate 3,4-dioxygenase beta subunit